MARRDAVFRGLFAVVYLPLYYLILYPIVFFAGVIVTAVSILFTGVTGRELRRKPRLTSNAWELISRPVTWIFSGQKRDKPTWMP